MSPKKKSAPTKSAPKDELINALFDSEGDGGLASENSITKPIAKPPPPPPAKDPHDRIYNFDSTSASPNVSDFSNDAAYEGSTDDTRTAPKPNVNDAPTLSIVRNPPPARDRQVQVFDAPNTTTAQHFEIEGPKTIVHSVKPEPIASEKSQTASNVKLARLGQAPAPGTEKLQKLEDVLRKLKPQLNEKPKAPSENKIGAMSPPPVMPVGVVAKAMYSGTNPNAEQPERAPTEPVSEAVPQASDPDEKTVAVAAVNPPAQTQAQPIWQDAKTELQSRMTAADNPDADREGEQFMPTEVRTNSPGARYREEARQAQPGGAIFSSAEAALRQSENLRIAQKRISDLENELERVRRENESLRSAGETLRRRMDELQAHAENAEAGTQEAKKIAEEERKVLKGQIQSRDREISEMKSRIDDAENRLESNFRKIRVRERDLEHRIEIIKAESQSITASKDRMILELKRQIDQISSELNHSKVQVQETFGQFKEKQETARRAVRALRIALTVLEGDEDSGSRKAE